MGNTALIITPDNIGLMRRDRTVYLLDHGDINCIIEGLNRSHTKTHVALTSDLSHPLLTNFGSQIRLSSIESNMRRLHIPKINFLNDLEEIRNQGVNERIINELNLIISYECVIYEAIQQQGMFFNEKPRMFSNGMNKVNRILERNPRGICYRKLKSLLTESYRYRNPPSYMVINIMIETGMIYQNRNTTYVSIPY